MKHYHFFVNNEITTYYEVSLSLSKYSAKKYERKVHIYFEKFRIFPGQMANFYI